MKELSKIYDPKQVEDRTYQFWLDGGYFHAEPNPDKKPYTIVIPPPNITGQLPSMPRTSVCSLSHVRLCRGGGAYAPGGVKIIDKR